MVGTWLAMVTHSPELRGVQLGLGVWGVTVGIRDNSRPSRILFDNGASISVISSSFMHDSSIDPVEPWLSLW